MYLYPSLPLILLGQAVHTGILPVLFNLHTSVDWSNTWLLYYLMEWHFSTPFLHNMWHALLGTQKRSLSCSSSNHSQPCFFWHWLTLSSLLFPTVMLLQSCHNHLSVFTRHVFLGGAQPLPRMIVIKCQSPAPANFHTSTSYFCLWNISTWTSHWHVTHA